MNANGWQPWFGNDDFAVYPCWRTRSEARSFLVQEVPREQREMYAVRQTVEPHRIFWARHIQETAGIFGLGLFLNFPKGSNKYYARPCDPVEEEG